jgi:photosystem II stability/assembly factor-like uncharacterized protein
MTTPTLYLATDGGLFVAQREAEWRIVRRGLRDRYVTCVAIHGGALLAGTTDGLFRSMDDGATWQEVSSGLSQRHLRWLAFLPGTPESVVAGTEPAAIFRSQNAAGAWLEAREVAELRDQYQWFLPYSPAAGCVRGFAFHKQRGYAAVEVGGVLRSEDGGKTWRLTDGSNGKPDLGGLSEPFIHPDLHSIQVHPSSPDLVFAATGGGFYRSTDGGKNWTRLYTCYCRAAWVNPADPDHILLGPADNVEINGRIEESRDGGATWRVASDGLPVPWAKNMVERFLQVGEDLFAVLSQGELIAAPLASLAWQGLLPEISGINALAAVLPGLDGNQM